MGVAISKATGTMKGFGLMNVPSILGPCPELIGTAPKEYDVGRDKTGSMVSELDAM